MEREKLFEKAIRDWHSQPEDVPANEQRAIRHGIDVGYSAASAWVPVSERLPAVSELVIVAYRTVNESDDSPVRRDTAYLNATGDFYWSDDTEFGDWIILLGWMPIPPFGGANEN